MGLIIPELEDHSVRELTIYSYRPIYRIALGQVEVLAIVHGRRMRLVMSGLSYLKN
nr:type II toxin-antitoxin system RelE/ParE family toxin [Sporomusa silvacetica]